MKPAFALDFRNDAITLLHRTSGGWHQVGRVPVDEPDLPGALSYLRATALGLSPRGVSTKLVLPNEQILLTTVTAPGPDDASRAAQIRVELEGRTPYAVEDLIFDWEVVDGEVRVAVVPRDTLAEAEAFAVEHRFNPLSFVAAPGVGYDAEPWFGLTAQAADILAPGETVEHDGTPITLIDRAPLVAPVPEVVVEVESETAEAIVEETPDAIEIAAEVADETEVADESEVPDETETPHETWAASEPETEIIEPEATPETFATEAIAPATFVPDALLDGPETIQEVASPYADPEPEPAPPPPEPRQTPIFGLADDELPPSATFRATSSAFAHQPDEDLDPDFQAALQDEAPMALDVEDDEALAPGAANPGPGDVANPGSRLGVTDRAIPADPSALDDVPPAPGYSSAMGFASRRASADAGQSSKAAPPATRPPVSRPTAAKPLVAPPKAERPALNRPTAVAPVVPKENRGLRGLGALVAPSLPGARAKKTGPLINIPQPAPIQPNPVHPTPAPVSAPQMTPKMAPQMAPQSPPDAPIRPPVETAALPPQGAKSLGRGLGARPAPIRGKPRHLGLILTGLLLLALALIAAWSTSLAFRSTDGADTQVAATEIPAAEDEMLADGQDPEALAPDATLTEGSTAEATPALETAEVVAGADPAAIPGTTAAPNPGASSGDEIFLAANDQAPFAPEPLDLPDVSAQGDPLPNAQAPPPPFGTVYQFDANGLIVPTPEGIITPEGVRLVAGKPKLVPKPRAAAVVAPEVPSETPLPEGAATATAALEPVVPDTVAPTDAQPELAVAEPVTAEPAFPSDPALAKFRPKLRPQGLTPPADAAPANPDDAALPASEQAPTLATVIPATDTAADLPADLPVADSRLAGKRPLARPQAVIAAGEAISAAQASAAASLAAQAEATAAAEAAAGPVSKLAVAISRKPAPRPRDLSRAVEAAVAAAVRTPEPQTEPEPEPEVVVASAAPTKMPKPQVAQPKAQPEPKPEKTPGTKVKTPPRGKDGATTVEADDEPEAADTGPKSAPSGSVAKQATFKNALNLDKTALIGVYGTPSNRYAMIRTSNGRYKKVKVGDTVDGGRIQAITASEVRYQKGSKLVTLSLPKG